MLKKWIALALSLVLMLTVLPMEALADPPAAETTAPTAEATTPEQTAPETVQPEAEEKTEETEAEEVPKPKLEPLSPAQAAIPTHKLPTKASRIQRLRYYIQWDYQNALEQEDAESLYGYCGLLASYQLFYRGINTWRRSNDGKDYFDTYSAMNYTDGGYTIRSYNALKEPPKEEETEEPAPEETPAEQPVPAEETTQETTQEAPAAETPEAAEPEKYTIAQILNQVTNNGTKEVYNLLVCFERTDTAAGSVYGHVLFVYGIIDGTVYFTEGGDMFGVKAGEPMECSISQFSASYATWTDFEGVIVFGCKEYLDNCAVYTSHMFATCLEAAPLRSLPSQEENSAVLRTAAKGERLQVVSLYENRDAERFYEIADGNTICYAPAEKLTQILFLYDPVTLEDPSLPQVLQPGKDFRLDGTVQTTNYMSRVRVYILDAQGTVLQAYSEQVDESQYDLYDWELNNALDFGALPEGVYTCRVEAECSNWFLYRGELAKRVKRETVAEQVFAVGEDVQIPAPVAEVPVETVKDGWTYEQQTWYCYDRGTPLTGWQQADGVKYYLQADGSVTTGWTLVDGQMKVFTATGALRTGWVDSGMGRQYLLADGTAAHGWMLIDGQYYYFNELGIMVENHVKTTMNQMAMLDLTPAADGLQTQTATHEE